MGMRLAGVTQGPRGRGNKKDSVTRCGMLARPRQGEREREREPLGTGEVAWRVICTHSPGLAPPWVLTGRLVPPPQEAPLTQDRPVLYDIKVLPGSMTPGYESWWRVGVAEASNQPRVQAAYDDLMVHVKETRKY